MKTDFIDGIEQWDDVFLGGAVLVDGFVTAGWRIERGARSDPARLVVRSVRRRPLDDDDRSAIDQEGRALLQFAAPDAAGHEVRIEDRAAAV